MIAIAVGASLAAGLVGGAGEHARQVERKDAELDLVRWTVEHVSPDADLLMASGPTLAVEHYTGRRPQALFSTSDAELRALVSRSRRLFVLADVGLLESQWKGLPPQRRLAMLQRDPGLDTVGQRQQYTLFAVRASAP